MPCVDDSGLISHTLETTTTSKIVRYFTGWKSCCGLDTIKGILRIRNVSGNFQAQPCYQLCDVRTDKPDAPIYLGSLTGAGESCSGESDISADTAGKMFIRFGVAYALSSGSALGAGDVSLQVSSVTCGSLLGASTQTFVAYGTGSTVIPITGFLPALNVAKWKVGVIVSGLTGNCQWRFVWRSAATSTEVPGAWTTSESYRNTNSVELNTGEIATSITADMFVQGGIEVSLSSGSTPAQVTLTTLVGYRRG